MALPPPLPRPSEQVPDNFWSNAALGGFLATVVGIVCALLLTQLGEQWLSSSAIWLAAGIGGVIAGAIQGAFIHYYANPKLLWLTASTSGWLAAFGFAKAIGIAWPTLGLEAWFGITALVGAIIGTAQWLLLRRTRPDTVWWIPLNASIWLLILVRHRKAVLILHWYAVLRRFGWPNPPMQPTPQAATRSSPF